MGEDIPSDIGELLQEVARRLRRSAGAALAPLGVTGGQLRALRVLARAGEPLHMNELATRLDMAPRSATSVVDALAERELVVRAADPTDRRATLVDLTAPGRAVLDAVRAQRQVAANTLVERLSAADRTRLRRLLAQLASDEPPDPLPIKRGGSPADLAR